MTRFNLYQGSLDAEENSCLIFRFGQNGKFFLLNMEALFNKFKNDFEKGGDLKELQNQATKLKVLLFF